MPVYCQNPDDAASMSWHRVCPVTGQEPMPPNIGPYSATTELGQKSRKESPNKTGVQRPSLSDNLRAPFGSTGHATEHASSMTEPQAREPIGIVGIGCRSPGGITGPDELWKALLDARDCVVDIPGSRLGP